MVNQLEKMRHSCSHVLAAAVLTLYPKTKLGIGPAIENGFYYDFDLPRPISEKHLEKIAALMDQIIKKKIPFKKEEVLIKKAREIFKNQPFKLELINDLAKEGAKKVSLYWTGDPSTGHSTLRDEPSGSDSKSSGQVFVDLCAGPHVTNTSKIGPFKLLSIAGAYWRGDEKKEMLTRIYGACFPTQKQLDDHLKLQEEAKKRDHRKIGRQLDLFSFHPEAPGDIFWHPRGLILLHQLYEYWREEHLKAGYVEVRTPVILTKEIWDKSGHTTFFIDKMYKVLTPDAKKWNMAIKPMNCDGNILIYKNRQHSYKEFPLRMGELGVVHRYETSGEVHGIIRLREFTQDDAHIFCTPEQVKEELKAVMALCFKFYKTFDLELDHLELSTRPEKSIGSDEIWEKAEITLTQALKEEKVPYKINKGEGAFYGPKIDFHLRDSLGRTWQCATIQLDFAQPENFDLTYITKEGKKERPVMIHRVVYGSVERFLGILIEQCDGAFPVWLSPVQAIVVPITDKHNQYGQKIVDQLREEKVRVELDDRNETASAKIRDAELQKIPYMLVVGDKEVKGKKVNVRVRGEKVLGSMSLSKFLGLVKEDIAKKRQV